MSPHGHVDPRILAENAPFPEPASLIVQPDHYILRLLYANGVPLESLLKAEPRQVWQLFAEHYHLFRGTPTGAWLDYELYEVFGIGEQLSGDTAARIYDEIVAQAQEPRVPAARAVRALQHRGAGDDRRGNRQPRAP